MAKNTNDPTQRVENNNANYPVLYLPKSSEVELFDYGKSFHTFKNQDGERVLFKETIGDFAALSEVFHSKAAIILGEPTVENELAVMPNNNDGNKFGITSKIVTQPNDFVFDANASIQFGVKYDYKNRYQSDFPLFQNLTLKTFIEDKLKNESPEFIQEFIRTWITSNVFANTDQLNSHNAKFICRDQDNGTSLHFVFPNFDYEQCMFFLDDTYTRGRAREIEFLQQGFESNNIAYLKEHHPLVLHDYFERLIALKNNPEFINACDFTGLENFLVQAGIMQDATKAKIKLERLSETVHSGYKERIDLLSKDLK